MLTKTIKNTYPEHAKLRAVSDKSQAIGAFLDYLEESGLELCRSHVHNGDCYDGDGFICCDLCAGEFRPEHMPINERLAAYFVIDEHKLEQEKRAMLAELRGEK